MLLVLMLAVAVLTITMLGVAGNYRRTILRDREVEMIHRGVQYERAVRLYYHKVGAYPTSIEQLENTNKIRYLRKRYKDPMSRDGQWQIAHITDIKLPGVTLGGAGGLPGAAGGTGVGAAAGSPGLVGANPLQASSSTLSSAAAGTTQSADGSNPGAGTGSSGGQTAAGIAPGNGPADDTGNGAGPVLGGGPMLGVMSKSTAEGVHSFNDKSKYNEWYFIYDPSQDTGTGPQLTGPYNPKAIFGQTASGTGTPGGQPGSPASPGTAPNGGRGAAGGMSNQTTH
jgi:type II secretory pathway pseudopilin PulG